MYERNARGYVLAAEEDRSGDTESPGLDIFPEKVVGYDNDIKVEIDERDSISEQSLYVSSEHCDKKRCCSF